MKIFIWSSVDAVAQQLLEDALREGDTLTFANRTDSPATHAEFLAAEVVFGNVPAQWLNDAPNLRWLQLESIGFAAYTATTQPAQTITNLHGFGNDAVAETLLAGLLALYRGIDDLMAFKNTREWHMEPIRAKIRRLHQSHVLILGAGTIGQKIAHLLRAFNCEVKLFARQASTGVFAMRDLDTYLPQADIVVGSLPHTAQTAGLFTAQRIDLMPPGAIFANVGRGSLVDEEALINALQTGKLGGAVLDVTISEPLPPDHALWSCPNTILTQHTAGGFATEMVEKIRLFLQNLDRYRDGVPLQDIVDFDRGY